MASLTREIRTLSLEGARIALAAAERAAVAQGVPLSLAIVDATGTLVAFSRMDEATQGSADAAFKKARTAALLRASSKAFEDLLKGGTLSLLAFDAVTPAQGGVPIVVDGHCLGAVGGSGGTGEQDEGPAQAGVDALVAALKG
jgi:glc operon protein GlcG